MAASTSTVPTVPICRERVKVRVRVIVLSAGEAVRKGEATPNLP